MGDSAAIRSKLISLGAFEPGFVAEFIDRLDADYFDSVDEREIIADARELARITGPGMVRVRSERMENGDVRCVVYATDFPGLFVLVTGLLATTGFNIRSGAVHTYRRKTELRRYSRKRRGGVGVVEHPAEKPRLIIDRFTGRIDDPKGVQSWQTRLEQSLREAWEALGASAEPPSAEGIARAKSYVYEAVAGALSERKMDGSQALYPVSITISSAPRGGARLVVLSEDTPFFLFALGNAVALQGLSIESVKIRTFGNRVEDEIDIYDTRGRRISDPELVNHLKLSILLTKQFTYFLGRAPDPGAALIRFESICREVLGRSSGDALRHMLDNPQVLRDLARILGASDFLWEDFLRTQYESLLPMLDREARERDLSRSESELASALDEALEGAETPAEKKARINEFKNREIYLVDVDHIVNPARDFLFLSRRLTRLAEVVVEAAVRAAYDDLSRRYGEPRGFAGLPAKYAILGLGKLGGAALGYASDIELLFVYSDSGTTTGPERIGNAEFFDRCFRSATNMIDAKQEGIFHIDLRLRPHGNSGPIAVSVDSFCEYYGATGKAHSYERLALVRMRAIGGDSELGRRIERLRDEMIYSTDSIDVNELRALRERQLEEKGGENRLNAKFSPGALVDLEYSVQIIQCRYGKDNPKLRTPRIHVALEEMVRAGHLESEEAEQIVDAYHFLRKLINGLRMLRGSARDLFLPDPRSVEYSHLARRMGYAESEEMSAAQRLHVDFETRTAVVRHFVESRLGRDSIPGSAPGNAADLVLSDSMPKSRRRLILKNAGFDNLDRAEAIISTMCGDPRRVTESRRRLFARLAVLAWDFLPRTPDPDMALNNWERFSRSVEQVERHYHELLEQPIRLAVLLQIFSGSQFLADILARHPAFLDWVADPGRLHHTRDAAELRSELVSLDSTTARIGDGEWSDRIRTLRRREVLRIGTRDICLGVPLEEIVEELTILADAFIEAALIRAWKRVIPEIEMEDAGLCVFAFGKLGGRELNYSSDVDLLATWERTPGASSPGEADFPECYAKVIELLRAMLSQHTACGYVYRVDLRLRPHGRAGALVPSSTSVLDYYSTEAAPWEKQALLKLRPVAGDLDAGTALLGRLRARVFAEPPTAPVRETIRALRLRSIQAHGSPLRGFDVKNDRGGIRDVEFLVQGMQLEHAARHPALVTGNTLAALERLAQTRVVSDDFADEIREDYLYLRRVEHYLQLLEDRQVHALPHDETEVRALARRLHGSGADAPMFREKLSETTERVKRRFDDYFSV